MVHHSLPVQVIDIRSAYTMAAFGDGDGPASDDAFGKSPVRRDSTDLPVPRPPALVAPSPMSVKTLAALRIEIQRAEDEDDDEVVAHLKHQVKTNR